jgi:hypothetical protein
MTERNDFACPKGLSEKGMAAYRAIMTVLAENDALHAGGCKVFYSPKEWRARGELYGRESELIIVYDGGDHRRFFNMDEAYKDYNAMCDVLQPLDLFFEECTGWYAAVYKG